MKLAEPRDFFHANTVQFELLEIQLFFRAFGRETARRSPSRYRLLVRLIWRVHYVIQASYYLEEIIAENFSNGRTHFVNQTSGPMPVSP